MSYDHRSYKHNLSNCVQKPEKVKTSTGFEPVTSRYRCDALTNGAMKPLTLGTGHLWVLMSPWRMDVKWFQLRSSIYETFHISLHITKTSFKKYLQSLIFLHLVMLGLIFWIKTYFVLDSSSQFHLWHSLFNLSPVIFHKISSRMFDGLCFFFYFLFLLSLMLISILHGKHR